MPSKTPKQAKFMRAIAHGWTPDRMKSPPSRAVAQEFVEADRKYSGGFAENRYWVGGLAAMDEVNAGYKGSINNPLRWQEGGYTEAELLGSARGGHVNYYQEGGEARPGHGEGPNPYEGDPLLRKSYARWEKKHHIDPLPPPPPEPEPEPEEVPWYMRIAGYGSRESAEKVDKAVTEAQAYGGYVGYQAGGLAVAAPGRILPPVGGVPPWIEPVGSGPGFSEPEPEGYQFGGMAARMGPAMRGARGMMQNYRGVPPQRGGIRGGGRQPRGGGRGFLNRFRQQAQAQRQPAQGGRGFLSRFGGGQPQGGGLAAMMRQAQQQQAGAQPTGLLARMRQAQQAQQAQAGGQPGGGTMGRIPMDMQPGPFNRTPSGEIDLGGGRTPEWGPEGPVRGGGNPNLGRPGYDPIGDMGPVHPGRGPYRPGKPMPGPGMMPPRQVPPSPPGGGGEITGGPRVPPNMQGYLQRMRMQNRPPSGPAGGGENRVGMADQQGAYARAMQRGTGRAPPSRRMGFGRAGRRR